jgi:hypothetical protein
MIQGEDAWGGNVWVCCENHKNMTHNMLEREQEWE